MDTVVGISTDKACKPVNVMGMTKAIQELVLIRANLNCQKTRFVCVRYGNVLASRGSVIPLFHEQMKKEMRAPPLQNADASKAIVLGYPQYPSEFFEKKNLNLMLRHDGDQIEDLIQRDWKPDVLHAQKHLGGGIIAVRLGLKYGIPVIITEHSNPFLLHLFSKYQQKLIRHALENAQCVAAVSHYQARNILMHNISCDPIVVGNLVDEEKFTLGDLSMNHQYPFHILTIAYLAEFKDMRTFFLSLKELVNRDMSDFHATVIGGKLWGNLPVGAYEELAADMGVEKHCTFVGFVERDEIVRYFHQADVFISTSISETFGVAVAEAMASGTPVITTDSGGGRETVNPETGIMVNIRDYRAVADAITDIWKKRWIFSPGMIRKSVLRKSESQIRNAVQSDASVLALPVRV